MKPIVYIESSVVSYLTSRPSRDMVIAAHQQITAQWWGERFDDFDLMVSELVVEEIKKGDPDAAKSRIAAIKGLPVLPISDEARSLAENLVDIGPIPHNEALDALHISIASVESANYLLTWNCKHLANASHRNEILELVALAGFMCPVICTPEELMED